MQKFKYKGQVVMASTMKQAISKIIASKMLTSEELDNDYFEVKRIHDRVVKCLEHIYENIGISYPDSDWEDDTTYTFEFELNGLGLNNNGNGIPKEFASIAKDWVKNNDSTEEEYEGNNILQDMTIVIKLGIDGSDILKDEYDEKDNRIINKNGVFKITLEPVLYDDAVVRRRIKFGKEKDYKLSVKLGSYNIVKNICDIVIKYLEDSEYID